MQQIHPYSIYLHLDNCKLWEDDGQKQQAPRYDVS